MTNGEAYWQKNLKLMISLLIIWFVVSFGFGILLVGPLNNISLGGYPLGFWFAQQGSMYVFVCLIFFYANTMSKYDREFGFEED